MDDEGVAQIIVAVRMVLEDVVLELASGSGDEGLVLTGWWGSLSPPGRKALERQRASSHICNQFR